MTETERWEIVDATKCRCFGGLRARDHADATCPQYLAVELTRAVQALDQEHDQDARLTIMQILGRLTGRA